MVVGVSLWYVTLPRTETLDLVSMVSGLVGSTVGRGAAKAEDAQVAPSQSLVSPSILVYEDKRKIP